MKGLTFHAGKLRYAVVMNVALIGFGIENQAAYRFFSKREDDVTICDQNPNVKVPDGAESQLGENYLDNLNRFELIVRTSGMQPKIILKKNPNVKERLTTAIDIFFKECKAPIIGVTGTKGKGTTSTLIAEILKASKKKVVLGGNIGIPALGLLEKAAKADFVVLELSSFQLEDITASPHVAVCLMVVPEHLNWHSDFEDYKDAKANLFRFQNPDDVAVFNGLNANSREIAGASPAMRKIAYGVPEPSEKATTDELAAYVREGKIYYRGKAICEIDEVGLIGRHNLENICAAIAATWQIIGGNIGAINKVVASFTGLPHRLEFVRQLNGVRYFDDSFSTTPETAVAAIKAFEEPKVLILGGSDKGIPFNKLADAVVRYNVRLVLAIGETGITIARLLRDRGFDKVIENNLGDMESIVAAARAVAETGDIVLLSPGCASYDMFPNYKVRAEQFQKQVNALVD